MLKLLVFLMIASLHAYGSFPKWSADATENLDIAYKISKLILTADHTAEDAHRFESLVKGIKTTFLLRIECKPIDVKNFTRKCQSLIRNGHSFDKELQTFLNNGTLSIVTETNNTLCLELVGYESKRKLKFFISSSATTQDRPLQILPALDEKEGKFGISIVIPTFNRIAECSSCITMLKSRISAPKDKWEVIVVDDGCTDGTGAHFTNLFKLKGFENFRVIYTDKKPGVYRNAGWPENSGVKAAKFSHISLCDCDVYHLMDPVSPSLNVLKDDKSALIVGNLHEVNMDGVRYRLIDLPWNEGSEPGWLVIRKKFFIEIGGNSEQLTKWGYEDTDLLNRLLSLGLKKKRLDSIISVFGFERKTDHKSNTQLLLNNNMRILESDPDIIRNKDNPNWGIFFESPPVAQIEPNFSATN